MVTQHTRNGSDGHGVGGGKAVDPAEVDALLVKELNAMTIQDREKIYEEIHGVAGEVDETHEFLEEKLESLEEEIQLLLRHNKAETYKNAFRSSQTYLTDRKFRLMFLRIEYYDPRGAARRLMRFLEGKKTYFGEDAVGRPLLLTDMNEADMECLKSGILQLLPSRDSKGRAVIADMNMRGVYQVKNIDSVIKTFIYIMTEAAEDEETQLRGMVAIFYYSMARKVGQDLLRREPNVPELVPIKLVGLHFCTLPNDPVMQIVKALMMLTIGRSNRLKVRMHEGSSTEVQYSLLSFGLPTPFLPVTYEGELKITGHLKWVQRRQNRDKAYFEACRLGRPFSFDGVDLPAPRDILLGRGKSLQEHFGNVHLRSVAVTSLMDKYTTAAKSDKNSVGMEVVNSTKGAGGRFLKRSNERGGEQDSHNGWWREVDDAEALDKVCKTFRATKIHLKEAREARLKEAREARREREDSAQRDVKRPRIESSCVGGSSEPDQGGWSLRFA